ncbi:hypothetical protein BDZ85DRAFT_266248 [Elsinoe ampelina]|uniref:Uncharacterized protein n=1 Tax=Elsinoe ampelina TaxID=302913 RepID=A0A6A6G5N9_9PEZI|nr:hypothetical protein BDZ85DRAFT_266248 [Elsinoe ampelina]
MSGPRRTPIGHGHHTFAAQNTSTAVLGFSGPDTRHPIDWFPNLSALSLDERRSHHRSRLEEGVHGSTRRQSSTYRRDNNSKKRARMDGWVSDTAIVSAPPETHQEQQQSRHRWTGPTLENNTPADIRPGWSSEAIYDTLTEPVMPEGTQHDGSFQERGTDSPIYADVDLRPLYDDPDDDSDPYVLD